MSNIKMVVLNNGLQLVGEYVGADETANKFIMKKPVQVVLVPKPEETNQVGIAFAPFCQFATEWETGIAFSPVDILTVVTPERGLVNHYNTKYGSGLVVPPGVGEL